MNLISSIRSSYGHGVVKFQEMGKLGQKSNQESLFSCILPPLQTGKPYTPKFLRIKTALRQTKKTQQIMENTSRKLLQENIRQLTNKIKSLVSEEEQARSEFEAAIRRNPAAEQPLSNEECEVLKSSRTFVGNRKEKEYACASERQKKKLESWNLNKLAKIRRNVAQNIMKSG